MNRYDHEFAAICPNDGESIIYRLTIKTEATIMVEDIISACRFAAPVFHEIVADGLFQKFGGRQKLRALHQGVHIRTTREPAHG